MSTTTRHSGCRLLFWKMSVNDNIASVVRWWLSEWFVHNRQRRPLFLSLLVKSQLSRLIYYQIDIWKTPWGMIIKNVCDVSVDIMDLICNFFRRCRDRYFRWISQHNVTNKRRWGILGIKIIFMEQKEHLLSNWESREWKHQKIIKGKRHHTHFFQLV